MKNYLKYSLFFILCIIAQVAQAQQVFTIQGKVTDKKGEMLPFASVYVKGTSQGTTTNEQGNYAIQLPSGSYEMVYQYIGFKVTTQKLTVQKDLKVDVVLEAETLKLKEIVVVASDEDPAYPIMRKAIRNRKKHLWEVKKFTCDTYVKGLQRLGDAPDKLLGMAVEVDTGIVYLSESVSKLSYQNKKYKEKMISSKISGNSRGFSFNRASDMKTELYHNMVGLGERGIVSPVAYNAMLYYRFRYEGFFEEDGKIINKIRLIPRRKLAPAFQGYIYIVEDSWRIHSAELSLGKGVIDFIDSVTVKQIYAPVGDGSVWRPLLLKYIFKFGVLGFKGNGYAVCIYSNYNVNPTFERRYFKNELMVVSDDANRKDSAYWNEIRPIPLARVEARDYRVKDSLEVIKTSKTYTDSVDARRNKLRLLKLLYRGYTYRNTYRKETFSFQPLITSLQYNTVEGVVTDVSLKYRKRYENRKYLTIDPTFRYGFSNQRFQSKLQTTYHFAPKSLGTFWAEGGRYVEQLSRQQSISTLINSAYSLLNEENFLKIYEKSYAQIGYQQEWLNGVYFKGNLEFSERSPLKNTTDYTWRNISDREFSSNTPLNSELANTDFSLHQAFIFNAQLRLRINQRYSSYPNQKRIIGSNYPTLWLGYRKGLAIGDSDVDYDLLYASLNDGINLGVLGSSEYTVSGGIFLNKNKLFFMDYQHFLGNQTLFSRSDYRAFQLLDYYKFSTQDRYLTGHYEHHFNGFFMNGLPLINKLKSQLVLSAHYLWTPTASNYLELGVGLEHILKFIRVDFVVGLQEGQQVSSGIRLGLGF